MITFNFNPRKALNGILWMLEQEQTLDFHTLLKSFYFADKSHLNQYGRPVFGANYRAMNFGPVPLEVYEMLKKEPYWLADLELDNYPWRTEGYKVHRLINQEADLDDFSKIDLESMEAGFRKSAAMTFSERTRETHGADWIKAKLGMMSYADMLDDSLPNKSELVNELELIGAKLVL